MAEITVKRGYLYGALVTIALMLIGYLANALVEPMLSSRFLWPDNLFLMLVVFSLGIFFGAVLKNKFVAQISALAFQIPSLLTLVIVGSVMFVFPDGFKQDWLQVIFSVPALLLSVYVFFVFGIGILSRLKHLKKEWSELVLLATILLFVFTAVVGDQDYTVLKMKVGADRAIYEGQSADGRFLRVPFAVKVLSDSIVLTTQKDSVEQVSLRMYNTVTDFNDINLKKLDIHKLQGWKVFLNHTQSLPEKEAAVVSLFLVYDHWLELKYASVILMMLGLFLKIKY